MHQTKAVEPSALCKKYYGKSYIEAMSMLLGESMEPVYPQAKKQEQVDQSLCAARSEREHAPRVCVFTQTRGLDADVVSYFARKKMLYEDAASQRCVHRHGRRRLSRHAHLLRSKQLAKAFRLNVESSDPRYAVFITPARTEAFMCSKHPLICSRTSP